MGMLQGFDSLYPLYVLVTRCDNRRKRIRPKRLVPLWSCEGAFTVTDRIRTKGLSRYGANGSTVVL